MTRISSPLCCALAVWVLAMVIGGPAVGDEYQERIAPFIRKYCVDCHEGKEARAELDLTSYRQSSDVFGSFRQWRHIVEFIDKGEMPPEDSPQPTKEERQAIASTVEAILAAEAQRRTGDPGMVLPRRLSNTEYDLSIRDLTGVDIRPTAEFPADPAAGEGFDNTGEALTMSPNLLKKYLAAAHHVSEYLVLRTDGIRFAPFPVTSYNERKKFTEQAIIDYYQAREVRTSDYLIAAWRYRHRGAADRNTSIQAWAQQRQLSPRYLALVWETLSGASGTSGYLQLIGQQWDAIPAPTSDTAAPRELAELEHFIEFCRGRVGHREEQLIRSNAGNWPIGHLDFRAKTAAARDQFDPASLKSQYLARFDRLRAPRENEPNSQSMTLYLRLDPAFSSGAKNYVIVERPLFSKSTNLPRNEDEAARNEVVSLRQILESHAPEVARKLAFGRHPAGGELDAESFVLTAPAVIEIPLPAKALTELDGKYLLAECQLDADHSPTGSVLLQHSTGKPLEDARGTNAELLVHVDSPLAEQLAESSKLLCQAFPNRFFYVDDRRGLAAGFHLVEGFFRDDRPLVEKVLSDAERKELDALWQELDFSTEAAETLIRGFVWFERSERHVLHDKRFDFLRSEDPLLVKEELLGKFERIYLDKMGVKLLEDKLEPERPNGTFDMIHGFFQQIRAGLVRQQELMQQAEQLALADLDELAERAYRRPLSDAELQSLHSLYRKLRQQGQGVEASLRGVFTAVLMSPDFAYHFTETAPGTGVHPLSNNAMASRLSYFLWSTLPDEKLLQAAAADKLQDPAVLEAHTRRMLKDPRTESFAREFLGQWLRYRDYLSKDPVNAEAFPGYDEPLRVAMFEEPIRLATWLIQEDRPITDLLNSDITFVNGRLAKHYGGEIAAEYGRQSSAWQQSQRERGLKVEQPDEVWHRVTGLRAAGRGGLFGMGVVLTKNSSGERTSPVKRGFWTVHHLLGQHFPPPPADVAELPAGEKEAPKTIRELLAEHASNPKCAMCHTHFDGLGLAMEGFDPIGRVRTKDLAGRPIDDVVKLPSGETAQGIAGLIDYIEQHRRRDFTRTFCRKFLGYALGRSVILSDEPLLDEMQQALEKNEYRFSVLFTTVVRSPQFRQQRGREFGEAGS